MTDEDYEIREQDAETDPAVRWGLERELGEKERN